MFVGDALGGNCELDRGNAPAVCNAIVQFSIRT